MADKDIPKRMPLSRGLLTAFVGAGLALAVVGCKNGQDGQQAPIVDGNAGNDPSLANMANPNVTYTQPVTAQPAYAQTGKAYAPARSAARSSSRALNSSQTRVAGQAYDAQTGAYAETYPQDQQSYPQYQQPYNPNANVQDDQLYADLLDPGTPEAYQPPPALPVYEQPPAPGPDYLWTPGYWDYQQTGYYYVPGNWVAAPFVGALWTPGWWGHYDNGYRWHHGYFGQHTGFYGGINYGFGYIGFGYQGGYWNNDHFYYNRYVNHVRPEVVNNYVYNRRETVVNNTYINNSRVSYFGGPGGLQRRATPAEFAAVREVHMRALPAQIAQRQEASQNRAQFFAANNGRPNMLFASRPVVQGNVQVPQQLQHLQMNRGPQGGNQFAERPGGPNGQQGQGFQQQQQQRLQAEQQQQAFRGAQQQQRLQADQQRQQQQQQGRLNEQQQRQQKQQQQRQQQQVARQQQDVQRQQMQVQHQQEDAQRQQMQVQRQQQDQQRQQMQQQRAQQDQQRAQQQQQHQQMQAQHQAAPQQRAPEQSHGNPGGVDHGGHGPR